MAILTSQLAAGMIPEFLGMGNWATIHYGVT